MLSWSQGTQVAAAGFHVQKRTILFSVVFLDSEFNCVYGDPPFTEAKATKNAWKNVPSATLMFQTPDEAGFLLSST